MHNEIDKSRPARRRVNVAANYPLRLDHRVLEETASDFHGHDLSVRDVLLDQRAEVGALACSFLAQQVTSRQMCESIGLDDLLALRSLAGTCEYRTKRYRRLDRRYFKGQRNYRERQARK